MDDKVILERVREYASAAHDRQKRKYTPEPYIVHPVRVMEICKKHSSDVCILSAALLHDVLEDTAITRDEMSSFLREIMSEERVIRTVKLVVELTDVFVKKDYPRHNRRSRKEMERNRIASTSPDSQTIKYADIIDNCREIVEHDPDFARVFLNECRVMLKIIPSGNQQLYEEANTLVSQGLEKMKQMRSGR